MSKRTKKVKHRLPAPTAVISQIPAAILSRRDLIPAAKIAFGCIWSITQHYPKCFITNGFLADAMAIEARYVKKLLKMLRDAKLITHQMDEWNHRDQIRVTWKAGSISTPAEPRKGRTPRVLQDTPPGPTGHPGGGLHDTPPRVRATASGGLGLNGDNKKDDDDHQKADGSSSSRISSDGDPESKENWPMVGYEAILTAKAFFGESLSVRKILAVVEVYTENWVLRALEIAEMRGKKPGKLPVKDFGFVIRTLKNWEQEGGPPPEAPAAKPASANGKATSIAPAPTAVALPRPVAVASDAENRSYAQTLLARLREQKKGGVPCDWRWDAHEKVYRYHGPEWIRTLMMPIQREIFEILDGERAAKESKP